MPCRGGLGFGFFCVRVWKCMIDMILCFNVSGLGGSNILYYLRVGLGSLFGD